MTYDEFWNRIHELQGNLVDEFKEAQSVSDNTCGEIGAYHAGRAHALDLVIRLLSDPIVSAESR